MRREDLISVFDKIARDAERSGYNHASEGSDPSTNDIIGELARRVSDALQTFPA
jgi:hypothetical protein